MISNVKVKMLPKLLWKVFQCYLCWLLQLLQNTSGDLLCIAIRTHLGENSIHLARAHCPPDLQPWVAPATKCLYEDHDSFQVLKYTSWVWRQRNPWDNKLACNAIKRHSCLLRGCTSWKNISNPNKAMIWWHVEFFQLVIQQLMFYRIITTPSNVL